tara:strand:+ start:202 stop:333 length:132 start_codon:yes stop_codon:yes gene_type:complete
MRLKLDEMHKEAMGAIEISTDENSITYWTGYADAIQRLRSILG